MALDPATIAQQLGAPPRNVGVVWPLVVAGLGEWHINTHVVQVAAAATIMVETRIFLPIREIHANPDLQPDLWQRQQRYWPSGYYGRGLVQTTWQENYDKTGRALGLDLLKNPDLLLAPPHAARALAWYFATHGVARCADLQDWRGCRLRVNGGYTAIDAFLSHVHALLGGES
jgi:hypothetical protein